LAGWGFLVETFSLATDTIYSIESENFAGIKVQTWPMGLLQQPDRFLKEKINWPAIEK